MTATMESPSTTKVVPYGVNDEQIAEIGQRYAALEATTPTGYKAVTQAIAEVRSTRTAIEKRRVDLKADALAWGKLVDSEAKRLTTLLINIEDPLKEKKAAVDEAKERAKRAEEARLKAIEDARIAAEVAAKEAEAKAAREAEEARLKAENDRLAAERAALEAEKAKLFAEQMAERGAAAERQRIADEKAAKEAQAERERLAAERLKMEQEQAAERQRIAAEQKKLADERRAIEAEKAAAAKAEADRLAAIAAKEAAEREAERQAALAPDRQKVRVFASKLQEVRAPEGLNTDEAIAFVSVAVAEVLNIVKKLEDFAGYVPHDETPFDAFAATDEERAAHKAK